jgi:hypothetical protein
LTNYDFRVVTHDTARGKEHTHKAYLILSRERLKSCASRGARKSKFADIAFMRRDRSITELIKVAEFR